MIKVATNVMIINALKWLQRCWLVVMAVVVLGGFACVRSCVVCARVFRNKKTYLNNKKVWEVRLEI